MPDPRRIKRLRRAYGRISLMTPRSAAWMRFGAAVLAGVVRALSAGPVYLPLVCAALARSAESTPHWQTRAKRLPIRPGFWLGYSSTLVRRWSSPPHG